MGDYTGRQRCINCGGLLPEQLRKDPEGVAHSQLTGESCVR